MIYTLYNHPYSMIPFGVSTFIFTINKICEDLPPLGAPRKTNFHKHLSCRVSCLQSTQEGRQAMGVSSAARTTWLVPPAAKASQHESFGDKQVANSISETKTEHGKLPLETSIAQDSGKHRSSLVRSILGQGQSVCASPVREDLWRYKVLSSLYSKVFLVQKKSKVF